MEIAAATSVALVAGGLFFGWWVVAMFGVLVAAGSGRWLLAFGLGLALDTLWGEPAGTFHAVQFPFAFLAVGVSLLRLLAVRYLFDKNLPQRI